MSTQHGGTGGFDGGDEAGGERFSEDLHALDDASAEARRRRLLVLLEQDEAPSGRGGDDIRRNGTSQRPTGSSSDVRRPTLGRAEDEESNSAEAASKRSLPSGRWRLQRLCVVAVSELGVDGAGVTVMGSLEAGQAGARDQLGAIGALTRRLEDLQLTTAEGPCLDAYDTGLPVLVADLAVETTRWLGFGPEAIAAGAAAVFSLPLRVGAVRFGTLDLHRQRIGSLSPEQYADALTLASLATETLLHLDDPDDADAPWRSATTAARPEVRGWLSGVHAGVHVASGMVSAQAGIDIRSALVRIRAHAFASGEPISDVAQRIIARDLVLDGPVLDHPGTAPTDPVDRPPDPENDL